MLLQPTDALPESVTAQLYNLTPKGLTHSLTLLTTTSASGPLLTVGAQGFRPTDFRLLSRLPWMRASRERCGASERTEHVQKKQIRGSGTPSIFPCEEDEGRERRRPNAASNSMSIGGLTVGRVRIWLTLGSQGPQGCPEP